MRQTRGHPEVILLNMLCRGQTIQRMMRADGIVDPYPGVKGMVEEAELQVIQIDFVKFFFVGTVSAFDMAVEFWGVRRQDEQAQGVLLAGPIEGRRELGTAVDLDGSHWEGHARQQGIREVGGCMGCGAQVGFEHIPAGDDIPDAVYSLTTRCKCLPSRIRVLSRHSLRRLPINRSQMPLARGAR